MSLHQLFGDFITDKIINYIFTDTQKIYYGRWDLIKIQTILDMTISNKSSKRYTTSQELLILLDYFYKRDEIKNSRFENLSQNDIKLIKWNRFLHSGISTKIPLCYDTNDYVSSDEINRIQTMFHIKRANKTHTQIKNISAKELYNQMFNEDYDEERWWFRIRSASRAVIFWQNFYFHFANTKKFDNYFSNLMIWKLFTNKHFSKIYNTYIPNNKNGWNMIILCNNEFLINKIQSFIFAHHQKFFDDWLCDSMLQDIHMIHHIYSKGYLTNIFFKLVDNLITTCDFKLSDTAISTMYELLLQNLNYVTSDYCVYLMIKFFNNKIHDFLNITFYNEKRFSIFKELVKQNVITIDKCIQNTFTLKQYLYYSHENPDKYTDKLDFDWFIFLKLNYELHNDCFQILFSFDWVYSIDSLEEDVCIDFNYVSVTNMFDMIKKNLKNKDVESGFYIRLITFLETHNVSNRKILMEKIHEYIFTNYDEILCVRWINSDLFLKSEKMREIIEGKYTFLLNILRQKIKYDFTDYYKQNLILKPIKQQVICNQLGKFCINYEKNYLTKYRYMIHYDKHHKYGLIAEKNIGYLFSNDMILSNLYLLQDYCFMMDDIRLYMFIMDLCMQNNLTINKYGHEFTAIENNCIEIIKKMKCNNPSFCYFYTNSLKLLPKII